MGVRTIKVPDIGEGIAEVELVAWHVQPGQTVAEDQPLVEVMTDKASVEIPSPVAGKVVRLGGEVGDTLAVGAELIGIEVAQEDGEAAAGAGRPGPAAQAPERASPTASAAPPAADAAAGSAPPAPQAAAAEAARPAAAMSASAPALVGATTAAPTGAAPPTGAAAPTGAAPPTGAAAPTSAAAPASAAPPAAAAFRTTAADTGADRPIASPSVRRRAWELGLDLRTVRPTGPAGRIMHADLDAAVAAGATGAGRGVGGIEGFGRGTSAGAGIDTSDADVAARIRSEPRGDNTQPWSSSAGGDPRYQPRSDETRVPVVGVRRLIARRMQEAVQRIPHFSYVEEVDVTELEALREQLNAEHAAARGRLTLLPFLVRALVLALREFPQVNARFDDEAGVLTRHGAVHAGIATHTPAGLLVPVLRHAESLDPWTCAAQIARLAQAARAGKASREELTGSTITITSLGALGGIASTPVINAPEVAIVGVNRIIERPVIRVGMVAARRLMNLSSSFDHRVIDGMDAAGFVQALRARLESPARLFIE